jgi:hypothetical protein
VLSSSLASRTVPIRTRKPPDTPKQYATNYEHIANTEIAQRALIRENEQMVDGDFRTPTRKPRSETRGQPRNRHKTAIHYGYRSIGKQTQEDGEPRDRVSLQTRWQTAHVKKRENPHRTREGQAAVRSPED